MALDDDLRNYMNVHGQAAIALGAAEVVIVGETHAYLTSHVADSLTTAMTRVLRDLLKDQRFRYFGNESFQNAGPVRQAIRAYLQTGALPPDFDAAAPGADAMDVQKIGARVMPRRFQPVLDDLRAKRYVLALGSRGPSGPIRHSRLAQHFFEEIADRRIARGTPGVLLLGAEHAAAKPFRMGQTTTRIILEQHGYRCTSILIMTDLSLGSWSNDSVFRRASGNVPAIRLGSLTLKSPISFNTRLARSPFYEVRLDNGDSGYSLADQYEFVVLHTKPVFRLPPTAP
jgi:hypothetical protein